MPTGNHLPENRRKARQVVIGLGMVDYDRIHACVNDCVLFRNEHAGLDVCPKCGEPKYKEGMQGTTIPRKVLRHFPRIQVWRNKRASYVAFNQLIKRSGYERAR